MSEVFSNVRKIELTDKSLFDKYFEAFNPEISEFTFTNLYIWRNNYDFLFTEYENHLVIFSNTYLKRPNPKSQKELFFLPPVGEKSGEIMLRLLKEFDNIEFHKVPERLVDEIRPKLNQTVSIREDRNNWDYVYNKQDLVSLPGNKYRHKRRWVARFKNNYDYEFNIIDDEIIEKARQLQLEWCVLNECQSHEDLMEEQKAIDDVFDNFSDLKIMGGILCVDGKCAGYTLGEMLNNDTIVIHIEKAHRKYEGSYQAVNNLFLTNCFQDAVYVNREQDLGIPGLRKAKESYKPVRMVKKYVIY